MNRARLRRAIGRAGLAIAGSLLGALLLEGTLRVAGVCEPRPRWFVGERRNEQAREQSRDETPRKEPNFRADVGLGWTLRPGVHFRWEIDGRAVDYFADSRGLRVGTEARSTAESTRSATPKIVIAGDSFAFGVGVPFERSFGALVARELGDFEPVVVAQPGYGLDQCWLAIQQLGLPVAPRLIVVAIYPEELERSLTAFRVKEQLTKPLFGLADGKLKRLGPDDRPGAIAIAFERHTHLAGAWDALARAAAMRWQVGATWQLNGALLAAIVRDGERSTAPIVFVHVPSKEWRPFPALARWMRDHGASYVDPVALSPTAPAGLYFEHDSHLDDAGHRHLADVILPIAKERMARR